MLMRPEAAFPYVFAAEGAQHPPKKPPRSTTLAAAPAQKAATLNAVSSQHPPKKPPRSTTLAAAPAQQDFTLIHSAVFHLIAIGVILLALPNRGLRKRYPYDSSPVNAS